MILLSNSTESLELRTSSNALLNVSVSYAASSVAHFITTSVVSSDRAVVLAAPTSGTRQVTQICMRNNGDIPCYVSVFKVVSGIATEVCASTQIPAGGAISYTDATGFTLLNVIESGTYGKVTPLLIGVSTVSAGAAVCKQAKKCTVQAVLSGTGTATVLVEISNTGTHWSPLGTFTLNTAADSTGAFPTDTTWGYMRGNVTAITGSSYVSILVGA